CAQDKQLDQTRKEAQRLEAEIATLPADLPKQVADGQTIVDELTALHHTLPTLSRFAQLRADLKMSHEHLQSAQVLERSVQSCGEHLRGVLEELRPEVEAGSAALQVAQD